MKASNLKLQQQQAAGHPSSNLKNFVDIKSELQMALNSTKNNPKTYGTMKNDTANNITKIYYSNKPEFLSSKHYQRLPETPSSDSMKRFGASTSPAGKKLPFMRSSPGGQLQSREGSISSGSNSRSSPKPEIAYQPLIRSRTKTPPKYLNFNTASGGKIAYNGSPTKPNLPSSSVLYHQAQSQNNDWKQQHQRMNSGSGGENKYRIQF